MKKLSYALAVLALVGAACGGNDDDGGGGDGNATQSQCNEWQDDFDAAEVFGDTDAMIEADDKMQAGGCYG
jgi:hypothetical protein